MHSNYLWDSKTFKILKNSDFRPAYISYRFPPHLCIVMNKNLSPEKMLFLSGFKKMYFNIFIILKAIPSVC